MSEGFFKRVYKVVAQVPTGKVVTYGQVARLVHAPRGARFVGFALHSNPDTSKIPCHRVVFRDGSVTTGYAFGGPEVQAALLRDEGVPFIDETHVDIASCQWDEAGFLEVDELPDL